MIILTANEMDIHPGILLGSLQHDGKVKYSFYQDLFQRLGWGGKGTRENIKLMFFDTNI